MLVFCLSYLLVELYRGIKVSISMLVEGSMFSIIPVLFFSWAIRETLMVAYFLLLMNPDIFSIAYCSVTSIDHKVGDIDL